MNVASPETVLITGASSGIGLELARCFAADKSRLVLIARNVKALEKLADELRQLYQIEIIVLPADLSLPETPKRIFTELNAKNIFVDVLVNNAGFGAHGSFVEMSLKWQLEMLQVNIASLTELTGLFLPGMIQRRRVGILNVGSVAGFQPGPGMTVYYATKAYVLSFTEALAEELAETDLTVSVLCPGPTTTNFGAVARGEKIRKLQTAKMSAATVADYGHRAFRQKKLVAVPGFGNRALIFMNRLMPRWFPRKIIKFYNRTK